MKDFNSLQADHETLLKKLNRLNELVLEKKNIGDASEDVHQDLNDPHTEEEREALEARYYEFTSKLAENKNVSEELSQEILKAAAAYIQEAKSSSAQIGEAREREQLRANLRFWASYIFEKTGSYPGTDLAPAPSTLSGGSRRVLLILIPILIVILIAGGFILSSSRGNTAPPTDTPVSEGPTKIHPSAIAETPSLKPSDTATALSTKTATPTPLTPTVTLTLSQVTPVTPTSAPNLGILVQLNYPLNGQVVSPAVTFSGVYTNLLPKWTIHVLLQPKTRPGLNYYPLPNYFTVPDGAPSGNWSITGQFGTANDLEKPEQYNIKLIIVTDAASLATINQATTSGIDSLPAGVIPFTNITNVSRKAYHLIDDTRLFFTSIDQVEGSSSIYTSDLNGKDLRIIPHANNLSESFPSLSPDGTKIAFVALRFDAKNTALYSIGIMDSNGDNPQFFFERADWRYEEPLWSPDGKQLVFSATDLTPYPGGGSTWNIYLANYQALMTSTPPPPPQALTTNNSAASNNRVSNRYPSWLDNQTIIYSLRTPDTQIINACNIITLDTRVFFDPKANVVQASLSPDKKGLVFLMNTFGGQQIYVARLNTDLSIGKPFPIGSVSVAKQFPRWDLTSQTIYYEFDQNQNSTIWAIDADGSNLRQITAGQKTSDLQPFVGHMVAYFLLPGQP